jgi:hypothetical protein
VHHGRVTPPRDKAVDLEDRPGISTFLGHPKMYQPPALPREEQNDDGTA